MKSRVYISQVGVEGALLVLCPLPFVFPNPGTEILGYEWQFAIALIAAVSCLICALTVFSRPVVGKISGGIAAAGCYGTALPQILTNPFIALIMTILLIGAIFWLVDFRVHIKRIRHRVSVSRIEHRAWWGMLMVPLIIIVNMLTESDEAFFSIYAMVGSLVVALILHLHWVMEERSQSLILVTLTGCVLIVATFAVDGGAGVQTLLLLLSLFYVLLYPRKKVPFEKRASWWEFLLSHPGRILLTSFAGMCGIGTVLLSLPASTQDGTINLVDAIFTSVSAVCVTGLIVLDTPNDFTGFGQFCILLLIQLGGLGIMSITTIALYTIGHRMSLKHERLLTSLADSDDTGLVESLKTILKFTFVAEGVGAMILIFLFYGEGDTVGMAVWRGIFTSVSAFCNAGFALQSDSLIPYQSNALILHSVALLIIFGGIAPATSLLIPKLVTGSPIPIPAKITLITTVILLVTGVFFVIAFEWNGVLSSLSVMDKIHNAWFQSVTLRTAGFNSVDLAVIVNSTFLVMIIFMLIGGSPGGTAGGVKTTTVGVLAMTFWANITNRNDVIIQNRRIHSSTIYRAITIIVSGMVIWLVVMLMLQITQQVETSQLVFEATSAIGTVGLSTGATSQLDEIGKVIIIIAMFAGRVGPMTLFMLLKDDQSITTSRCPVEKISLT